MTEDGGDRHRTSLITARVTIAGMTSVHAAHAVFTALAAVEGIVRADVAVGRATIEHDGRTTRHAIEQAIDVAGYTVADYTEERRRLPLL